MPDVTRLSDEDIRKLCTSIAERFAGRLDLSDEESRVFWALVHGWHDRDICEAFGKARKTLAAQRTQVYRSMGRVSGQPVANRADFWTAIFPIKPFLTKAVHPVPPPGRGWRRPTPSGSRT